MYRYHELYLNLYQLYKCLFGTEPYLNRNTCNLLLEENTITNIGNITVNINTNDTSLTIHLGIDMPMMDDYYSDQTADHSHGVLMCGVAPTDVVHLDHFDQY
jgi:hypothetical protein